jgi:hypothetical protein
MLGATRLTWVTVAMSTQSGDRHHLGSCWVAILEVRVWVLDMHPQYIEMLFSPNKHSLEIPHKFVSFLFLILKQFNSGTLNVIIMK